MTGMEDKQPVSTTCSLTAARLTQSTRPQCRISTTGTGNSSGSDTCSSWTGTYRRSRGPPITGHLEETVLYSVDDYYTVQPVTPSLSASGGDHQTTVTTTLPSKDDKIPLTFTPGLLSFTLLENHELQ